MLAGRAFSNQEGVQLGKQLPAGAELELSGNVAEYVARTDEPLVLADAMKRAGSTDPAKVRDALATTKDFPCVTGKTTLDGRRNATKSAVIITVKDGKFKYLETIQP